MPVSFNSHPSSYRDPSGFVFTKNNNLYRQVNKVFADDFEKFISGGCYDSFIKNGWLIPHETIKENLTGDEQWFLTLKPEKIPFISYPYEWSFDMLKDAALLTLNLLKNAIAYDMILKDASPYNVQWLNGRMVFIDSLSFERYDQTQPWIAYRQFCEHFLSPLLLAHYTKQPVQELLLAYPDGIPLSLTSALLPRKTKFALHIYLHIHLHAKYSVKNLAANKRNAHPNDTGGRARLNDRAGRAKFSRNKLFNLVKSLEIVVGKLKLPVSTTAWSHYYEEASQRDEYLDHKKKIITQWLDKEKPSSLGDLGANTGEFSMLAASRNVNTVAADFDAFCINALYNQIKTTQEKNILPVIIDLSKPSPAIGLNNMERDSFITRAQFDMVFALALMHHLAIGKNVPLEKIANFFQSICDKLVIEFVPKEDPKVQFMLSGKKDIYNSYSEENFLSAFTPWFPVWEKEIIAGSGRTLYLMKKNEK